MTYRIGELAKMLDLSAVTLRLWEKSGLIPKASRSTAGQRKYSDSDLKAIRQILESKQIGG
jgi:DNA-binding transcriptional MerR regulator